MTKEFCDVCGKERKRPLARMYKRIRYLRRSYNKWGGVDLPLKGEHSLDLIVCPNCCKQIANFINQLKRKEA